MSQDAYQLVAGPTKFDLMLGLFDGKKVSFKSKEGLVFNVNIMSVESIKENGSFTHWKMQGFFWVDGRNGESSKRCVISFWPDIRQGMLVELSTPSNKFKLEQLEKLSDPELEHMIKSNKGMAIMFTGQLRDYSGTLGQHDQLVIEALLTRRLAEVSLEVCFEHKVRREGGSLTYTR